VKLTSRFATADFPFLTPSSHEANRDTAAQRALTVLANPICRANLGLGQRHAIQSDKSGATSTRLQWNCNSVRQRVPDQQDQVAAKIVCLLACRIFDPVIARIVAERTIFKLAVAVLDKLDLNLPGKKIEQDFRFRFGAGKEQRIPVLLN
jgi:hypothetical protein